MDENKNDIEHINERDKTVKFKDGTTLTIPMFKERFINFWTRRIAGETIVPNDMERFMARTSAKNLKLLMKGKKMEGYLEGTSNQLLSKGGKLALGTIMTVVIVLVIVAVILKNQGFF
jgi:hypothetical protein